MNARRQRTLAGLIVGPHVPFPLFASLERVQTLPSFLQTWIGVTQISFTLEVEDALRVVSAVIIADSGVVTADNHF